MASVLRHSQPCVPRRGGRRHGGPPVGRHRGLHLAAPPDRAPDAAVAGSRGAAAGRPAGPLRAAAGPGRSRCRGRSPRPRPARPRHADRRRRAGGGRLDRQRSRAREARESRPTGRGDSGRPRGGGQRAPPQRDARDRHALRRGPRPAPAHRDRQAGAAADGAGEQVRRVRTATIVSLALALGGAPCWRRSPPPGRRLRALAASARRYAAGDLSSPVGDYGDDELGDGRAVARRNRPGTGVAGSAELARDRARMEAILGGDGRGRARGGFRTDRCNWSTAPPRHAHAGRRRRRSSLRRVAPPPGNRRAAVGGPAQAESRRASNWYRHAPPTGGSSPGPRRSPRPTARARCSCCTTSPICVGPRRCGAISSRTSRTSCGRP